MTQTTDPTIVAGFIENYCIDCRASDIRKGETNLGDLSNVGEIYEERKIWEDVYK